MTLQAILDQIQAAGQAQVEAIQQETRAGVGEILARATVEARQIEEDACAAACAPAVRERSRLLQRARLDALRLTGEVREGLVDAALAQTRSRLAGLRTDPAYPAVLRRLTQEALDELAAHGLINAVRLSADRRDRVLLESILASLELELPVGYELDCWGGVIARSADGQVVAINTLETRLERAVPFLRAELAAIFEKELPDA